MTTTLQNDLTHTASGVPIIASFRIPHSINHTMVLCHSGGVQPWVVWYMDDEGMTYWARYFDLLSDAAAHFERFLAEPPSTEGGYRSILFPLLIGE